MRWSLIEREGEAYVASEWRPSWDRPIMMRDLFPTGVRWEMIPAVAHSSDITLTKLNNGQYQISTLFGKMIIQLQDGAKTIGIVDEGESIKQPRKRRGQVWRWLEGEWR